MEWGGAPRAIFATRHHLKHGYGGLSSRQEGALYKTVACTLTRIDQFNDHFESASPKSRC